ncbi:hypothetical protein GAH_01300 [Geoglobus ahangari]|uniref:DUF401 family protein n=1 Tax=Geoglobus ahangari TaxID=113653 RepID=A0A0F7IF82_9EURY|nr:DUF401 family protein [Geoglobus ahangari]AKG91398.1 hypothetical protein GAH_01300 [Geoglobus ahangari]
MDVVVTLLISVLIILLLIRFEITLAVFAGALFLAITSAPESILATFSSISTWRIVAIVVFAFSIGYSMEVVGMLKRITESVHSISGRMSVALIPMLIGLLPMPGGALVSAVMIKDLVERFEIRPEKAVFINYWFRHVWVTFWPLYPNIVIAMGILSTDYSEIARSTYPILVASLVSGVLLMGVRSSRIEGRRDSRGLAYMYPVLLIVLFTALTGDLLAALIASFLSIILFNRAFSKVPEIFRKTVDFKIIVLVIGVMLYKNAIEMSNASSAFYSDVLSLSNPYVAAFSLSFLIAFATGIELSYTSVALPLLTSFTGTGDVINSHLFIIFLGGITGVMLSPMHLCLVLTAQYFKARLYGVYRYLIPAALMTVLISLPFLRVL